MSGMGFKTIAFSQRNENNKHNELVKTYFVIFTQ